MAHLVEDINDSDYFSGKLRLVLATIISTPSTFLSSICMNADGVPKEGMRVDDVLVRIANISLIEEKVHVAFSWYWHFTMT